MSQGSQVALVIVDDKERVDHAGKVAQQRQQQIQQRQKRLAAQQYCQRGQQKTEEISHGTVGMQVVDGGTRLVVVRCGRLILSEFWPLRSLL